MTLALLALVMAGCTVAADTETGSGYQGGQSSAVAENGNYDNDAAINGGNRDNNVAYGNGNRNSGYAATNDQASDARNETYAVGYQGGQNGDSEQNGYDGDCILPENETVYVPDEIDTSVSLAGYGSTGALADDDLTLADMLTYALQDEYLAHAEYEYIIGTYGAIRPFTNIIRAEETHIEALLPLFETYGIAEPTDDASTHVAAVASLTEAYEAGVEAEIMNIDMYEAFLSEDIPSDVRIVFEDLMRASGSHLNAFENKL
jgi:hypothetical protein